MINPRAKPRTKNGKVAPKANNRIIENDGVVERNKNIQSIEIKNKDKEDNFHKINKTEDEKTKLFSPVLYFYLNELLNFGKELFDYIENTKNNNFWLYSRCHDILMHVNNMRYFIRKYKQNRKLEKIDFLFYQTFLKIDKDKLSKFSNKSPKIIEEILKKIEYLIRILEYLNSIEITKFDEQIINQTQNEQNNTFDSDIIKLHKDIYKLNTGISQLNFDINQIKETKNNQNQNDGNHSDSENVNQLLEAIAQFNKTRLKDKSLTGYFKDISKMNNDFQIFYNNIISKKLKNSQNDQLISSILNQIAEILKQIAEILNQKLSILKVQDTQK